MKSSCLPGKTDAAAQRHNTSDYWSTAIAIPTQLIQPALLSLLLCLLLTSGAAQGAPIPISTIDVPPWSYADGARVKGIFVDLAQALAQEAGLQAQIRLRPYARTILEMKTGQSVFCFMLPGAEIDEAAVPSLPFHAFEVVLIAPAAAPIQRQRSQRLRVATLLGTPFGALLSSQLNVSLTAVKTPEQQLLMMQLGRVDAIVGLRETTLHAYNNLVANGKLEPSNWQLSSVAHLQAYLYISKKHFTELLQQQLNSALSRLILRGELEQILKQHLSTLPPSMPNLPNDQLTRTSAQP